MSAAKRRAYSMPSDSERETFVEADVKGGTNAMVIKSVALDHIDLVVLSIRGTMYTSFKDWASNMTIEPQSPAGFLDNSDNLCHAGFLGVARQLIKPVASRLRQILRDNPSRSAGSLVITGHSTGGAIASLLYAHMLSQNVKSDLINLRRSFNRIHCVTFGAPPVSAQPLNKPSEKDFQNWLFFSIINEGDPVTLAERPYVRCLIDLYNTPPPPVQPAGFLSRKFAFLISRERKKFDKRKATSASLVLATRDIQMTSVMKHGGSPTRAAQVNQERSTSPLFAPEPSYFYPYARPESAHLRSSKESESKASLSLSSNDRPLSFHGAVRDLKELRALYVPFISSEEDLTPSSSNTANYIQSSSIVSVPSSQCRLPQASAVSVTSRPGSSRQSFHMGKFTPPARINARSGRFLTSFEDKRN
ncbi:hypothetical protein CIHG_08939 [Coccidioides immitis H538.4]|uniref:Fungal lipase-type domain-containing protein n=1 Tax=Coccidioides immitis H538.4 TaxID=396776 RepID=A0A0J8S1E6_COCIT|nr:hypothetical protein CIHG_08939 [Coccidioides immitis H538.4]